MTGSVLCVRLQLRNGKKGPFKIWHLVLFDSPTLSDCLSAIYGNVCKDNIWDVNHKFGLKRSVEQTKIV